MNRILFAGLLLLFSCAPESQPSKQHQDPGDLYETGFRLVEKGGGAQLTLHHPTFSASSKTYALSTQPAKDGGPSSGPKASIKVPLRSVVCTSTTQAAYFSALQSTDLIVGLANTALCRDSLILQRAADGKIAEVGNGSGLDLEAIIALQPDLVLLSSGQMTWQQKLLDAGLDVLPFFEDQEAHPLGRVAWLRVAGALVGRSNQAEDRYQEIIEGYNKVIDLANDERPLVFLGTPWKGVWYAPGGRSLSAKLIQDAGALYLFEDHAKPGNLQLDIEVLMDRAQNADAWGMVIAGNPGDLLRDLQETAPLLANLGPVRNGEIFYCNTLEADYFGKGVLEPDKMLLDLVHIFSPEKLPDHQTVYFHKL